MKKADLVQLAQVTRKTAADGTVVLSGPVTLATAEKYFADLYKRTRAKADPCLGTLSGLSFYAYGASRFSAVVNGKDYEFCLVKIK